MSSIASSAHTADGHADFYLPACTELYHCWLNAPDLFAKDCYYWPSTQRAAYYAFFMNFVVGTQYSSAKGHELRVRPVRSELID